MPIGTWERLRHTGEVSRGGELRSIVGVVLGFAGLVGFALAWFLSGLSGAKWGSGRGTGVLALSVVAVLSAALLLVPWDAIRRKASRERDAWREAHETTSED